LWTKSKRKSKDGWNFASRGGGKRGGLRIIYFWQMAGGHIYLLTIYRKNEFEDLSKDEYKLLKKVVERW
jgi:hypothetical protein